jgi:hypothetical protein
VLLLVAAFVGSATGLDSVAFVYQLMVYPDAPFTIGELSAVKSTTEVPDRQRYSCC